MKAGDRVETHRGEKGTIVRECNWGLYNWLVDIEYSVDDYNNVMREPYREQELKVIDNENVINDSN